jgi:hypothetical protein
LWIDFWGFDLGFAISLSLSLSLSLISIHIFKSTGADLRFLIWGLVRLKVDCGLISGVLIWGLGFVVLVRTEDGRCAITTSICGLGIGRFDELGCVSGFGCWEV